MKQIPLIAKPAKYSPDWLRSFKGCEHYNDQEATEILQSLKILANILVKNAAGAKQNIGQYAASSHKECNPQKQAA